MKIAILTVTYNDDYKLNEWIELYKEYSSYIDYHIIIDNGSNVEYLEKVRNAFSKSVIIENPINQGSTGAYNRGIEYVLECTDAEYIMLLGNDVRISGPDIRTLAEKLKANEELGMVAPLLFDAHSDTIADFGCGISEELTLIPYLKGKTYVGEIEDIHFCEAVTGGANMAPISFYKKVGLQDEKLFMYSDEVDMGIRAKQCGYKMAAISSSKSWHEHINPDNSEYRKPYSSYLMARNKIYIAYKHGLKTTKKNVAKLYLKWSVKMIIKGILLHKKELFEHGIYTYKGVMHGLKIDMAPNKYTCY